MLKMGPFFSHMYVYVHNININRFEIEHFPPFIIHLSNFLLLLLLLMCKTNVNIPFDLSINVSIDKPNSIRKSI